MGSEDAAAPDSGSADSAADPAPDSAASDSGQSDSGRDGLSTSDSGADDAPDSGADDAPDSGQQGTTTPGGIAAEHRRVQLPLYVAPTSDKEFNTLVKTLVPLACWRLEDLRFDFDSSFVKPEAKTELGHLAALRKSHDGAPITVFGHADPTGDDGRRSTASLSAAISGIREPSPSC